MNFRVWELRRRGVKQGKVFTHTQDEFISGGVYRGEINDLSFQTPVLGRGGCTGGIGNFIIHLSSMDRNMAHPVMPAGNVSDRSDLGDEADGVVF